MTNLDHKPDFVTFGMIGVFATFAHVAVFSALVEVFHAAPVVASIPAFLLALLVSYAANHRWTFRAQGSHATYLPRYTLVSVGGLGLNISITYTIVNVLGEWYGIALVIVVTVVPIATFLLNKHWTYGVGHRGSVKISE